MFSSKILPHLAVLLFHSKLSSKHCIYAQQSRFVRIGQIAIKSMPKEKQGKARIPPKTKVPKSPIIKANKGVGHQMALLSEFPGSGEFDDTTDEYLDSAVESLEDDMDFFEAGRHDYHEITREVADRSRKLDYKITERKFFKPPVQPNLLTYAEKEHIKFLHEDQQSKWSFEMLAESYPATPEIIKKICKSKWKALSAKEIVRHDASVKRNWENFKKGKLTVSDDLREHLKRFSKRNVSIPHISEVEKFIKKPESKPKKIDEFSKIIESHRRLQVTSPTSGILSAGSLTQKDEAKSRGNTEAKERAKSDSWRKESESQDEITERNLISESEPTNRRARHFTFDAFRSTVEKGSRLKGEIDSEDRKIINSRIDNKKNFASPEKSQETEKGDWKEENVVLDEPINLKTKDVEISRLHHSVAKLSAKTRAPIKPPQEIQGKNKNEVTLNTTSMDDVTSIFKAGNKLIESKLEKVIDKELAIQEYIRIPKHLRKKDKLYKVKDCFYSDDGMFLYRVPGLKS